MAAYTFRGEQYGIICGVLGSNESSAYPRAKAGLGRLGNGRVNHVQRAGLGQLRDGRVKWKVRLPIRSSPAALHPAPVSFFDL
jgi:hypothetical protein